jgi:hypothetical protein
VDYRDYYEGLYHVSARLGLDPFGTWMERCREVGIRPHLSIRMNDCHDPAAETSPLREDFFYEARRRGMMNGTRYGHYRNTLNYRFPEIRARFLALIEEQLLRYDVEGIELDFMRETVCFDYADKDRDTCVSIMTDFMRQVKATVDSIAAARGKKIQITVRLARDLDRALAFGFDARTYAKEGLVDVIVPSPRFHGSDSTIPVAEWQRECPHTLILPCIESFLSSDYCQAKNGVALHTAETVRGHAIAYREMGAEGIYTYNLFGQMDYVRDREIQRTLGEVEDMYRHPVRFITVGEDWDICPEGFSPIEPFPCRVEGKATFRYHTGKIPEGKTVVLRLGFTEGEPSDVRVTVGGVPVSDLRRTPMPHPAAAARKGTVCYAALIPIPQSPADITVERTGDAPVTITWVELDVRD